jgi:TonB family protein
MQTDSDLAKTAPDAKVIRRRAFAVMVAFVLISAAFHFTVGPFMTVMSPHWSYPSVPEDALSIVTLSHRNDQETLPKPTPTPTPPPVPLLRTNHNLVLLKYRELGVALHMAVALRPPSRRKVRIVLDRLASPRPPDNAEANVALPVREPTPQPTATPGSARADTAGNSDQLSGSIVWGDDNPPRLIKQIKIDNHASRAVRVQVEVDTNGRVISVEIAQSSGDPSVDQAALDAARNSTFAPATLNGLPVHGTCIMEFPASITSTPS